MKTELGIDICVKNKFTLFKNERLGLLINSASVDSELRYTQDLFINRKCKVTALFGPEHGIKSDAQAFIKTKGVCDKKTGIPIFSLYGETLEPTREMLKGIDIMVIDLQDIGTRYYTYIWTMALVMKACAKYNKKVIVLDRPNPINGVMLEGTILNTKLSSFVGIYPIPVRHGMTVGELAKMFNEEFEIGANLQVVKMKNWQRKMWMNETRLHWVLPSPNMPTLETATVYAGMCLLEGTNISEGRGTTKPFEIFGAPWIKEDELCKELEKENLPGVKFRPLSFIPVADKFKKERCGGAQMHIPDRNVFSSFITGISIIKTIKRLYPKFFEWKKPPYEPVIGYTFPNSMPIDLLVGNSDIRTRIDKNCLPSKEVLQKEWKKGLLKFDETREKYLLY
ncbi:MAG: DUF1343 domain-containing protein [bacterium]|nr:DUF1343 domain-containing protein [bacterium]